MSWASGTAWDRASKFALRGAAAYVAASAVQEFGVTRVAIEGRSMHPTILPQERVLVHRWRVWLPALLPLKVARESGGEEDVGLISGEENTNGESEEDGAVEEEGAVVDHAEKKMDWRQISRGEVVVMWSAQRENELVIKRVVGVAGDLIRPRNSRRALVRVPPGHVWLEGDNGMQSIDSNLYGPASLSLLYGVATHAWPGPGTTQGAAPRIFSARRIGGGGRKKVLVA